MLPRHAVDALMRDASRADADDDAFLSPRCLMPLAATFATPFRRHALFSRFSLPHTRFF